MERSKARYSFISFLAVGVFLPFILNFSVQAAPTVKISMGSTATSPFDFTFSVTEGKGLTNLDLGTFSITLNGTVYPLDIIGLIKSGVAKVYGPTDSYAMLCFPDTSLPVGSYSVAVSIRDLQGNIGSDSKDFKVTATEGGTDTRAGFTPARTCGTCHPEIYNQWKTSFHAKALKTMTMKMMQKMYLDDKTQFPETYYGEGFCIACHSPQIMALGEERTSEISQQILEGEINPDTGLNMGVTAEAISCDICHSIVNVDETSSFPAPKFSLEVGDVKYGPYKDSESPFHQTQYSDVFTRSEFCRACHQFNQPNILNPDPNFPNTDANDPRYWVKCCTVYDDWKRSTFAAAGVQCQDCHMKPVSGRAAIGGPEREAVYTHKWPGPRMPADGISLDNDLSLELITSQKQGNQGIITVRTSNVGAGHSVPNG